MAVRKVKPIYENANKNKKKSGIIDIPLLVITIILVCFGLIMVLSASSPISLTEEGSSYAYFLKQLRSAAIGLIGLIILARFDLPLKACKKLWLLIYLVSIGILFLVLVPGVGISSGGAR